MLGGICPAPSLSPWLSEREALLQRICTLIENAKARGIPVRRSAKKFAKRWNGKPFKREASRTFRLSEALLLQLYYHWRKNACVPSAFRLKYFVPLFPWTASILGRFAEFCAETRLPNLETALEQFQARRGNFGRGRRAQGKLPRVTVRQLSRYFPLKLFKEFQSFHKERMALETKQGALLHQAKHFFRLKLPDRPKRIRSNPSEQYEI